MIGWPERPFNPLVDGAGQGLTVPEAMAGPAGLVLFLGLVPLVRFLALWNRPLGILLPSLLWLGLTAGVWAGSVLLGWVVVGTLYVYLLIAARRRGVLTHTIAHAALWLGLTALVLPLWWRADWAWNGWYELGSDPVGWLDFRTTPLHFLGFAYFYLRLLGWGRTCLAEPERRINWAAIACWLAYPPSMRLGPLIKADAFEASLGEWNPRAFAWRSLFYRFGLLVVGSVCAGVLAHNLNVLIKGVDFFSEPERFPTGTLIVLLYLLPLAIYLFLWIYNELAAVAGLMVGIPVPDNFHWVPLATNLGDFWRRWHLTVSDWLKHNIYFSLGGGRKLAVLATFATFAFCGIWHGASWSFVLWAVLQTAGISVQRWWGRGRRRDEAAHPAWVAFSWFLTVNYATVTTAIFLDFEHAGTRVIPELLGRLTGGS